jgi:putative aldouronate transport system substrate-binding protein
MLYAVKACSGNNNTDMPSATNAANGDNGGLEPKNEKVTYTIYNGVAGSKDGRCVHP